MSVEASIADLESDIGRLRAEKAEFVERRARTWSRWGPTNLSRPRGGAWPISIAG